MAVKGAIPKAIKFQPLASHLLTGRDTSSDISMSLEAPLGNLGHFVSSVSGQSRGWTIDHSCVVPKSGSLANGFPAHPEVCKKAWIWFPWVP